MDDIYNELANIRSQLPIFIAAKPKPKICVLTKDICFKCGTTVMVKDHEDKGVKLDAMRTIHTEIRIVDKTTKIHKINIFGYSRLPIELERMVRARKIDVEHINDKFLGTVNILDPNRNIEEQIIDTQGQLFIIGTGIVYISEYEKVTPRANGVIEAALILKDKIEYVKILSGTIIKNVQGGLGYVD